MEPHQGQTTVILQCKNIIAGYRPSQDIPPGILRLLFPLLASVFSRNDLCGCLTQLDILGKETPTTIFFVVAVGIRRVVDVQGQYPLAMMTGLRVGGGLDLRQEVSGAWSMPSSLNVIVFLSCLVLPRLRPGLVSSPGKDLSTLCLCCMLKDMCTFTCSSAHSKANSFPQVSSGNNNRIARTRARRVSRLLLIHYIYT